MGLYRGIPCGELGVEAVATHRVRGGPDHRDQGLPTSVPFPTYSTCLGRLDSNPFTIRLTLPLPIAIACCYDLVC